ncbi:extracellular solute-binding protein [Natribaculum luteum]|uniref:Extracellular solute-binding protein n=1 Tax=Natribaculum luteum TaxID=1586232 RepID=A0ABD5P083_9EURY|nr:extracellular solute-binding protein [Natribaculum luteum]
MAIDEVPIGRRSVLSAIAVGLSGVAGCSGSFRESDGQSVTVSMLTAGSLNNALENGLRPNVDSTVQIEAHGSAEVARLIAEGQKDPEIVSVADTALFDSPLQPDWFAEFATNSIVIAYNSDTEGGQQLADAGPENWYQPLLDGNVAVGRTDPDLDPLGYRALFMLELATEYYGTDANLREAIPSREQIYPETQLVSQFETGSIDAAIAYRNMAVERGYDYIDLPAEIDLSDPAYTDTYSSATYELPSGKVVSGGLISYGSTIRHRSPTVVDVFDEHITGQYLNEFGFVVPDDYPRFTGDAPDAVTR